MAEFIYTAVLAALVAGGGVYIFYPDLKKAAHWRPLKKAPDGTSQTPGDSVRLYVAELYETHYSEEEELLEAHRMIKRCDATSFAEAFDKIHSRQYQLIEMMTASRIKDKSISGDCTLCGRYFYVKREGQVKSNCHCNALKFRQASEAMGEQFGASWIEKRYA